MPDYKDAAVLGDSLIPGEELGQGGGPVAKPVRIVVTALRTFQILGMALVVFLMFLTVAHVIGRYAFNHPMLGVVEVSGLMVVVLVFCAAPYDFVIGRHIAVDVLIRRLPCGISRVVNWFTYLISLVMIALALIWTIKQGLKISDSGARTDMLHIPLYPFYFVVAFGWLLSMGAICARLVLSLYSGGPENRVHAGTADKAAQIAGKAVEE